MAETGKTFTACITGIKEAEYFVKFAESFLYPLQPLYTEQQLNEFTVQSDVSILKFDSCSLIMIIACG